MEYGKSVTERIETFERMHGASVYDGTWIFYEDGACREGTPLGALHEPPADARKRHQNICRYHQVLVDRKVREFDDLKKLLQENPGLYPDDDKNLERLRALQAEARALQAKLRGAQEELRRVTPGYRTPEEEEEHLQNMAATAAAKKRYTDALNAINI